MQIHRRTPAQLPHENVASPATLGGLDKFYLNLDMLVTLFATGIS